VCVVVTDGGGLNASVDVSLRFTDVDMQLVVFPSALNVTHWQLWHINTQCVCEFLCWHLCERSLGSCNPLSAVAGSSPREHQHAELDSKAESKLSTALTESGSTSLCSNIEDNRYVTGTCVVRRTSSNCNTVNAGGTVTVTTCVRFSSCSDQARLHLTIIASWQQSLYVPSCFHKLSLPFPSSNQPLHHMMQHDWYHLWSLHVQSQRHTQSRSHLACSHSQQQLHKKL
jgi:hypothetical protein